MITLRPHQDLNASRLTKSLVQWGGALDASEAGTGKSFTALDAARRLRRQGFTKDDPLVICPLSVGPGWEDKAQQAGEQVTWINYEKARRPGWQVPTDRRLIIFDECHRLKSPKSQQAQLALRLTELGHPILGLSATPFATPLDTRAVAHFTGVTHWSHHYQKLKLYGCRRSTWIKGKPWKFFGDEKHLQELRESFGDRIVKTKWDDLHDGTQSVLTIDRVPLPAKDAKEINEAYDEIGHAGELMTHRVQIEQARVASMIEMAKDELEQGRSVLAFFNFTEPLRLFAGAFDCGVIDGSTPSDEREKWRKRFQVNSNHVLALNSKAGGEGIDLHDINGRPRTSLISPTPSAQDFLQVVGRTRRDGSLSVPLHRLVLAADTYEDHIAAMVAQKQNNIETLTDADFNPMGQANRN